VANGYSATPGIVAGALTVNGPITSLSDAGIRIGAAAPFVRLYKDIGPGLGLSYNLGTDSATRDNTGLGATELLETDTLNSTALRILNPAGTSFFRALDQTLAQDGTFVSHTGDTVETTLKTKLIAANTLGADGELIVETFWQFTSQGGVASTFRVRYGGVVLMSEARSVAADFGIRTLIQMRNNAGQQDCFSVLTTTAGTLQADEAFQAVDSTVDQNLTVTFQGGAATDNWTLRWYRVHAFGGRTTPL